MEQVITPFYSLVLPSLLKRIYFIPLEETVRVGEENSYLSQYGKQKVTNASAVMSEVIESLIQRYQNNEIVSIELKPKEAWKVEITTGCYDNGITSIFLQFLRCHQIITTCSHRQFHYWDDKFYILTEDVS